MRVCFFITGICVSIVEVLITSSNNQYNTTTIRLIDVVITNNKKRQAYGWLEFKIKII